jgi:hypothetical protein
MRKLRAIPATCRACPSNCNPRTEELLIYGLTAKGLDASGRLVHDQAQLG